MNKLDKKNCLVMGVANSRSIASGIAKSLHSQGANLGYSYHADDSGKMKSRVEKAISEPVGAGILARPSPFKDLVLSH